MHKGKSLVEQLFDGEIYAAEQFNPYESKDYKKELEEVREVEDIFTSSLPSELHESYEDLVNARAALASSENYSHFARGFYLGAQLMKEILQNEV